MALLTMNFYPCLYQLKIPKFCITNIAFLQGFFKEMLELHKPPSLPLLSPSLSIPLPFHLHPFLLPSPSSTFPSLPLPVPSLPFPLEVGPPYCG